MATGKESVMKCFNLISILLLLVLGCGNNSTSPVQESYAWEEFSWIPIESELSQCCQVSYAVHNDSIYVMGVQVADTSSYYRSNMPDIVSFDTLVNGEYAESYRRDGTRALTTNGSISTDDWYEYYYPYGLGKESLEQSIPNQPDTSLGGTNDVSGIFLGELNGDSTVVFRKAMVTGDTEYDIPVLTDSTYGVCVYLQWGFPGDPHYRAEEGQVNPVTF